jgi:hypothetical protein
MHDSPFLAYIDPVSGTLVLQLAVAAMLGGIACCTKPVRKLIALSRQFRSGRARPETPPVAASRDEAAR